jgi:hypothetical protein
MRVRLRRFGLPAILGFCVLGISLQVPTTRAQIKDMPSQAEFDPILDNADKKLKDFAATLNEFKLEADGLDREKLTDDLSSIQEVQHIIRVTHGGTAPGNGVNLVRLVGIVTGLDDMAMDAGTWKEVAELQMCIQGIEKKDITRLNGFGARVSANREMLREVSNQLTHPALRLMGAADEIISTSTKRGRP